MGELEQTPRTASLRALKTVMDSAKKDGFTQNRPVQHRESQRQRVDTADIGRRRRYRWTGSGHDKYDPHLVGALLHTEVKRRGWSNRISAETVVSQWEEIVGPTIAEHCSIAIIQGNTLDIRAQTTAWSTQLRMLQPQILSKIAKMVGPNVVTQLRIKGPQGPSWKMGPRHVKGRGPRDTYG